MYKIIAGIISIAILVPMVAFSGPALAAQDSLEGSVTEIVAASEHEVAQIVEEVPAADSVAQVVEEPSVEIETQLVAEPSTDMVFSPENESRLLEPGLLAFVQDVFDENTDTVAGIYVDDEFAMPVVQQPSGQPGYVSTTAETITEFGMAQDYGSIGMLAHNYLAGEKFFELNVGDDIFLVYGDREVVSYSIVEIASYQALSPNSPYSAFVNLENPGEQLSAADLFYRIYDQDDVLILQTCIANEGNESWGRLFVIAVPDNMQAELTTES
ncbi:hypothetical protein KQH54_03940 [bacterium]|nr:hypothetical protein [bacterium]